MAARSTFDSSAAVRWLTPSAAPTSRTFQGLVVKIAGSRSWATEWDQLEAALVAC